MPALASQSELSGAICRARVSKAHFCSTFATILNHFASPLRSRVDHISDIIPSPKLALLHGAFWNHFWPSSVPPEVRRSRCFTGWARRRPFCHRGASVVAFRLFLEPLRSPPGGIFGPRKGRNFSAEKRGRCPPSENLFWIYFGPDLDLIWI